MCATTYYYYHVKRVNVFFFSVAFFSRQIGVKLVYATIPRPEEIEEYYYDEDAEPSVVLYDGLFEINTPFYPAAVANFRVSQKDVMYTTRVGLSAIIIKVALTDELFLKVCSKTTLCTREKKNNTHSLTHLLFRCYLSLCTQQNFLDIKNELNVTTSYERFSTIISEFAVFAENENHIVSNLIVSVVNFNKTLKVICDK